MADLTGFYSAVLKRAGLPVTPQALKNLSAWGVAEGGWTKNAAAFNPLNTTRGSQFRGINSVGVRAYPDFQTGVQQTVDTLKLPYYKRVLASIGAPTDQFAQTVYSSPWGTKRGISNILPTGPASVGQVVNQTAGSTAALSPSAVSQPAAPPVDTGRQKLLAQVFASNNALIGVDTPQAVIDRLTASPPRSTVQPTAQGVPVVNETSKKVNQAGAVIVALAHKYIGTPYVFGAAGPKAFDCSGLVSYLYGKQGVNLPHNAQQQYDDPRGTPLTAKQLQPGDPVFFRNETGVHHEGIYIGAGQFIQAPHTGDVVKVSSLSDPYYAKQFAGGRRFA